MLTRIGWRFTIERPTTLPSTWSGSFPADFTLDNRVVKGTQSGYLFTNALTAIPTLSSVTPRPGIFWAASGIYSNFSRHGDAWERPASFEWIRSDGRPRFYLNAGSRIHGGISRSKDFTPKHGFSALDADRDPDGDGLINRDAYLAGTKIERRPSDRSRGSI